MTPVFAHHLEPHHVLVMTALFAAGWGIGWHWASRLVRRKDAVASTRSE